MVERRSTSRIMAGISQIPGLRIHEHEDRSYTQKERDKNRVKKTSDPLW
jgi:hypothetical protein